MLRPFAHEKLTKQIQWCTQKAQTVKEIAAWEEKRNEKSNSVDWRFTTADARIKLKKLYPSIQS
jgi:hypothetical protein